MLLQCTSVTHRKYIRHAHSFMKLTVSNTSCHSSVWKAPPPEARSHCLSPVFPHEQHVLVWNWRFRIVHWTSNLKSIKHWNKFSCSLHTGISKFLLLSLAVVQGLDVHKDWHHWLISKCPQFSLCLFYTLFLVYRGLCTLEREVCFRFYLFM